MRKLVVSSWVSLDGVFDAGTMSQWFNPYDSVSRQEHIREGILESDALLLGRLTYEMLAPYWSAFKNDEMGIADKLNSLPKHIVSSSLKDADWNNSTIIRENIVSEVARLKKEPGNQIQIEGSATLVHSLMEFDLIDEYRLLVHPIIMGVGKRFFKDGMPATGLRLVNSKTLELGVIYLCYQPAKK